MQLMIGQQVEQAKKTETEYRRSAEQLQNAHQQLVAELRRQRNEKPKTSEKPETPS